MKIAIIIERVDVTLGGAERSIFELTQALSVRGLDVTILAAKAQADIANVHVLCPHCRRKRIPRTAFETALKSHLAREAYDIVHSVLPYEFADVYQPRGGTYAETILQSAASYESCVIGYAKRLTAFANRRRQNLMATERSLCSKNDGPVIAALSHYVAEQFARHYHTPSSRIALIANGVEIRHPADPAAVRHLRDNVYRRLGVAETKPPVFFLFAAHNFRLKGLGPLLRALADATQGGRADRRCCLMISGNGRQQPYQQQAKRLGLESHVVFLGPVTDIQNALALCDVAILPTFYDPSSRFILEALAAGKPVVTTRFNGATDLFEADRHGVVVDSPVDIPALSKAISRLTDRSTIRAMTDAIARDRVKENVCVERVAAELVSLYTSVLGKRE